ncbi:hypothetical protein F2P81_015497 [Scophthalmus maximus]|uniref:Tetratricopeptide repeat protein 30 n=1 Tax=Scophthalmus maximus TaxID=52904 RepID=A0A6A4SIX4_SCOMX|nr:hypothetical protein F2P81_015497 [Scophthalmus maximus]
MFYSVGFELKLLFVRLSDDESLIWTFPTSTVDLSVFVSLSALSYNIALCHYSLKNYTQAHKFIGEIIDRGIREHPELSVGMTTEGIDVHSVGNTLVLHETALIEASNLKAAIEYQQKNLENVSHTLSRQELDPVTLHNQALVNMDTKPSEGFEKLAFLLQQPSFPPVTFGNLLLLYCKHEYMYEFLDALLTCQTAPEEAFRKFDEMNGKLTEQLRKLAKQVVNLLAPLIFYLFIMHGSLLYFLGIYLILRSVYIVVLMAQAKIYWNRENFQMVEKIFRKSVEVCNEDDTWRLNVAHVLFMQNKYKEAIGFYEPIVKKHYDNILNVSAVVLANLCVSYIMTSQNEEAEELMRKIEKEEEQISYDDPDKKVFHLCIVNLVIGTLYCAKGNYEFGISRVIKSLEPYNKKRCFLSLLENMSKHMVMLRDTVVQECIQFLEHCEVYGKDVPAIIEQPLEEIHAHIGKNTVTYEARLLKALFYDVIGWNK